MEEGKRAEIKSKANWPPQERKRKPRRKNLATITTTLETRKGKGLFDLQKDAESPGREGKWAGQASHRVRDIKGTERGEREAAGTCTMVGII